MRQFTLSRRVAALLMGVALTLLVLTLAFAFVSTPGTNPRLPNYPYLAGRNLLLIADLVVLSSLLLGIALVGLVRQAFATYLVVSFGVLMVGAVVFVYTLIHCVPTGTIVGNVCVQPYPQSIYAVVWGITGLAFLPLVFYLERSARKPSNTDPSAARTQISAQPGQRSR